jgi:hypothetical protein
MWVQIASRFVAAILDGVGVNEGLLLMMLTFGMFSFARRGAFCAPIWGLSRFPSIR